MAWLAVAMVVGTEAEANICAMMFLECGTRERSAKINIFSKRYAGAKKLKVGLREASAKRELCVFAAEEALISVPIQFSRRKKTVSP